MSEVLFKCRIKVPRHSSKKNEKKPARLRGRAFVMKTEAAKLVEDYMVHHLHIQRIKSRISDPITCDLVAVFKFYFPESVYFTKKGKRSQNLPDLSNLYQLPEDVLQTVKIIANDTQIESHAGSGRFPIDGNEYWLEIELYEFKRTI